MNILYFDCFSGISGDMTLGALLDLGADPKLLRAELAKLGLSGYELMITKKSAYGLAGADVEVILPTHGAHNRNESDESAPPYEHTCGHGPGRGYGHRRKGRHRHGDGHGLTCRHGHNGNSPHLERCLSDIENLLQSSGLSPWVRETSIGIFREIAGAEARVHGSSIGEVHFHEVGAVDSLVDIVGSVICLDLLGRPVVYASPLHEGSGFIRCRHGLLPVPVPAVMAMLEGSAPPIPVITEDIHTELITPTGMGLLKYLAQDFGPMPPMTVQKVGYGLGKKDVGRFNALRLVLGASWTPESVAPDAGTQQGAEELALLETNIDDMSGEIAGYLMERLMELGALDVYYTPVYMKKNRPGIILAVLTNLDQEKEMLACLFSESTTLGVRRRRIERYCLERRSEIVDIGIGTVRVKVANTEDGEKITPEYEDCRKLAKTTGTPLQEIYRLALKSSQ